MTKNTPLTLGIVSILLSLPTFFFIGLTVLLSFWACGDSITCSPSGKIITEVIVLDALSLFMGIVVITSIYCSFKLAAALKRNSQLIAPSSYKTVIISSYLLYASSIVYMILPYQLRREMSDLVYFGLLLLLAVIVFVASIYFIKKLNAIVLSTRV